MNSIQSPIPQPLLEQWYLDELGPNQKNILDKVSELDLVKLQNQLDQDNEQFLKDYHPEWILPHIIAESNQQIKTEKQKANVFLSFSFLTAAVLVVLLFLPFAIPSETGISGTDSYGYSDNTILKGASQGGTMYIYRQEAGENDLLTETSMIAEGDRLQFGYYALEMDFGMMVSLDGNFSLTEHFPSIEHPGTQLVKNQRVLIPYSYILDDAPDFEKWYFFTSKQKFDPEKIIDKFAPFIHQKRIPNEEELKLPKSLQLHTIKLVKE